MSLSNKHKDYLYSLRGCKEMIDIELLEKIAIAQASVNEKVEKEKKAARTGRIYKRGSDLYVVTFNDGFDICIIHNDGFAEDKLLEDFNLGELIAEYPTWEEAVNSPEFKGKK